MLQPPLQRRPHLQAQVLSMSPQEMLKLRAEVDAAELTLFFPGKVFRQHGKVEALCAWTGVGGDIRLEVPRLRRWQERIPHESMPLSNADLEPRPISLCCVKICSLSYLFLPYTTK